MSIMNPRTCRTSRFAALAFALLPSFAFASQSTIEPKPLLDVVANVDRLGTKDAALSKVTIDGQPMVRVNCGHDQFWPTVIIKAPAGTWDLSKYETIAFELHNPSSEPLLIRCRIDNPGSDGDTGCIYSTVIVPASATETVKVDINRSPQFADVPLFGMRIPPRELSPHVLKRPDHLEFIDPSRVSVVSMFLQKPQKNQAFDVSDLRAIGQYHPASPDAGSFLPFIDTYGQYMHQEWPGKIHSDEDLIRAKQQEEADLQSHAGPGDWDEYGGYAAGPTLQATGFFRAAKYNGKWWLVDPIGHLFFSTGADCVGMVQYTPIDDRSSWFENFPGNDSRFQSLIRIKPAYMYYYGGKTPKTFSFDVADMLRKYGPDWLKITADLDCRRLRSWGLNTVSIWSADRVMHGTPRTPYIASFAVSTGGMKFRSIEGSQGYWGKFVDVFDPSFAAEARRQAFDNVRPDLSNDPWCIGYFVDNELSWGRDSTALAVATLCSPATQPAKLAFLEQLMEKYSDVSRLNQIWGTNYSSWDALLQSQKAPSVKKAYDDLWAFDGAIANKYFDTIRNVVKLVAPNQMYLGCRFSDVPEVAVLSAAKYCDIVSFNFYQATVDGFHLPDGVDVPLISSEFGFGAQDHGVFGYGAVNCSTETGRAEAYANYLASALSDPHFVGTQWFQFADEPTIGRFFDGENYEMGFVDICDTPYPKLVSAARQVGNRLYEDRLKK